MVCGRLSSDTSWAGPLLTDGFLGFCGGKFSATIIDLDHLESAEKAYNYI